ncbi:MAG: hypothetical protein K0S65_5442 [Labilithrix sp.]|nr:hypothetical protein [Labilithrix sp.]
MSRLFASIFATTSLGIVSLVACGSDRGDFRSDQPDPFAGADGGDAAPDAPQCGYRCSRDLKKVLKSCGTDDDQIVEECTEGKGCGLDSCVDACTSAAMSKGSAGCSFWTLPPDDGENSMGSCFAAMVANTWDVPVHITAEYGAEALDISKSIYTATRPDPNAEPVYTPVNGALPPGEVAIIFLAQAPQPGGLPDYQVYCPKGVTPALKADPIRHGTTKTKAFHLETDVPIAAYSIFPYGGASSIVPTATVLLPVTSWDTTYVAMSPAVVGKLGPFDPASLLRRTIQIVANEDDTKISMRPNADVAPAEGVTPGVAGELAQWTIAKGEVLQITQPDSISGSPVVANKPIAMFGGSPITDIPSSVGFADMTQQQITPFSQWGTSYALVPYRSRLASPSGVTPETVPWSFIGAVDSTVLTYDPAKPPGAPDTLAAGEIVTFQTDALVTVKSQDSKHPFHVSLYMTGGANGGGLPSGGFTYGDPDFVGVVPTDQFLDRYIFFADYTFPDTSLTLVRRKTTKGFEPVTLGCAGEITGWQPLGTTGEYEFAWVLLTSGSVPQKFGGGTCGYGRHEASSNGPFSVNVWGIAYHASYGYPGGMGSRPVNDAPDPLIR